jgi:hypothetical protein
VRLLCNLFGGTEKTYGILQPELSISRSRFEWSFIECTGIFKTLTTRYVLLPRANLSVCFRSAMQLNVAKASTNRDYFSFYSGESCDDVH